MKKYRFIIIIVAVIIGALILISFLQSNRSSTLNMTPYEDQKLVYYGEEDAENEMLFVFDYACPWCTLWMDEVYPEIEERYIDSGELKFRTQAMIFVNNSSLTLADFDQNLKEHAEDQHHEIFSKIVTDSMTDDDESNWGSEAYITEIIEQFELDEDLMNEEPSHDSIQIARAYQRALNVEVVPSLYINGVKVEDTFDLDQIDKLIK